MENDSFHQENRRALMPHGRSSDPAKLIQTRPVDIWPPLRRPADLPGRIDLDEVFSLRPGEERMEDRDHVRAGRSTSVLPAPQRVPEIRSCERIDGHLG